MIFSTGEAIFKIEKTFRRPLVWRSTNERYQSDCLVPSYKSGHSSVMVWGAFQDSKKSQLVRMAPNRQIAADFDAQVYDGELDGFWEGLTNPGSAVLMEDGAPIPRAKAPD